jgi:hypothetical protein
MVYIDVILFSEYSIYILDKPKRHSEDSRTALAKTVQLNRNEIILYRINSDNNITME